jgi:DNA repair protein RadC
MSAQPSPLPPPADDELQLLAAVLGDDVDRPLRAGLLLGRFGTVQRLGEAELPELLADGHLADDEALRLHAAFRLGLRAARTRPSVRDPITTPDDAVAWLEGGFVGAREEELHALYLDRRHRPLARRTLTRGSDQFTIVDPRQVFRPAIGLGAAGVILAHNHPSGDPSASSQDLEITRRVARAGEILGVRLLDHLVFGGTEHTSLAALGALPAWQSLAGWTA